MHKCFRLFLLFYLLFFCKNFGFSQEEKFKHYGLPEGLPQETVTCMVKDDLGYLWLGTQDGITRFDGTNFSSIVNGNKNIQIEGEQITTLNVIDKILWIGTAQSGLFYYNYYTQKLQQIGPSNKKITSICNDETGNILVSFLNDGVYKITKNEQNYSIDKIGLKEKHVMNLLFVKNRIIYSTNSGKIFSFNNNDLKNISTREIKKPADLNTINNLVLIENDIWVCSQNGLYKISKDLSEIKKTAIDASTFNVFDIVKFNKTYFLATNKGLLKTEKNNNRFHITHQYISKEKYDINAPNGNIINDLIVDKDLLLVGGSNLDITQISKNNIVQLVRDELNIGNPSIFSFYKYNEFFFIGTADGLIVYDGTTYTNIIPTNRIRDLEQDNDNNLWITTSNKIYIISLDKFTGLNTKFTSFSPADAVFIRNVYKDNKGTMWMATQGDGIYRFTGNIAEKKYTFKKYEATSNDNKLPSNFILEINQDAKNNFWISTQTGLCKLTFKDGNYKNAITKNYFKGDNGLKNHGVLSTFSDVENNLWIATHNGLHLYNQQNDSFIYYGKNEGLSNTFIYNILEDNLNNLWLSTNGGLFRFNKKNNTFSNYTTKDGLQSQEFNLGAAYKDTENDDLFFGGINGFNILKTKDIDKLDKEGNLLFTNYKIKDNEVIPDTKNTHLQQNISLTKNTEINYNDFPINLSFSAFDFRPNSNIEYVYKLLPDDEQWNELKDKNTIQLLNLSPKKYTLQIQGMSRGKLWSKVPLELTLNVKPPWYKSTLAYLLYLAIFLSIVYFYYKIMLQRRLAHQESLRLKDLDDLKSRFITNITHEFRTPLTIILGYLGNLKEQFHNKKDTLESLETVEQNSNNLLSLVNQMLDLAKLEKGSLSLNLIQNDIIAYTKHVLNSFSSIADDKKIELTFDSKIESLQMDFDSEKIRQIITNLLSNALKFSSKNTEVKLCIEKSKNSMIIRVSDQGFGIPQEELTTIFDRFYQVNNDNFKVSQGTGIGLALTKELVELMNGNITVSSEIKEGTVFKVTLPITQNTEVKSVPITDITPTIGETAVPELENIIHLDDSNTVLIVEDNNDMARYIDSCLSSEFKTIKAVNGKQGLEMAIAQIPDLILTDIMMPIMDGYELTKKLQYSELTNHIPIIMLTSKAMQEDKMEGLESGVDVYLTKPFSKKELLLRIKNLIAKRAKLQERYQVKTVTKEINKKEIATSDKNLEFLNKAISCIHNSIDNSEFNAPELAQELTMSDSQLYRKLKAISNISTAVFIRKVRLEKAKELMQTTDLTIAQIAYSTGFNDPNWFSRIFKREFGVSPTEIYK